MSATILNLYRHIPQRQALEREYSPSSCVTDIREFLDAYVSRSEAVRKQLPERRVLAYGESSAEVIDFFPAPAAARPDRKAQPVLVYIHGGYWQELSKDEHSFPAAALHRHGIGYIAVGYGLAPAASMKEMVDRCRRAIAWVAMHGAQLTIDPTQIHVAGSSAGAHLAAMAGLTQWSLFGLPRNPIRSLTLLSGIFDLRPLLLTYVNDAVRMNEEDALLSSPQLRIDALQGEFPPSLVAYGDNETAEFKRQSGEFVEALTRKGHTAILREIAGRNHFDLPFDLAEETTVLGKLMLDHCRGGTK